MAEVEYGINDVFAVTKEQSVAALPLRETITREDIARQDRYIHESDEIMPAKTAAIEPTREGCSPGYILDVICAAGARIIADPANARCGRCDVLSATDVVVSPTEATKTPIDQLRDIVYGAGRRTTATTSPIGAAGTTVTQGRKANPIAVLLILAAVGGIGYYLYRKYGKKAA